MNPGVARHVRAISIALAAGAVALLAIAPATGVGHARLASRPAAERHAAQALQGLVTGHALRAPGLHRVGGLVQAASYNWSGYVDDNSGGNTYQFVKGSWVQPAVKCTPEDQWVITFVGLDGWTDNTVEQAGTYAQCYQGVASYWSWWEMYPTNNIINVGAVKPGDHITASVSFKAGMYTLAVKDATTATGTFTINQACGAGLVCNNTSADWVVERPGGGTGLFPLPNFNKWGISGASVKSGATTGVISTFPDEQVTMVDTFNHYSLAAPGALNATGNGFADTWHNSY